jgi:Tfp pilus assembly protein PilF
MRKLRETRLEYLAFAVVLALAFSSIASAQAWAGKGRVQGKVTGPDGEPLEGVKVTLLKGGVEGEGPEPQPTNKKGSWSYLGLTGGAWTVILEYEGMLRSEGTVHVSEFSVNPQVKIEMKPIPEEALEQAAADERRQLLDRGNSLLEQGKLAEARAAYMQVMDLIEESQHPALLRGIARTYYQEGDVDQAIASLEKALAVAPEDEETLRLAINLLVASSREADAQAYMERLPQGTKMDPNTLLNLGIQHFNDNDFEGALGYFNQTVEENPDMADAYYYRGLTNLNLSHNEQAKADFKKLLEIDPDHANAGEAQQFLEYLESQE